MDSYGGNNMKCCDIGEFKCDSTLVIPENMKQYYTKRVFCDVCIVEEIQDLLDLGVITLASCCGHGILDSSVIVDIKSQEVMTRLDYEVLKVRDDSIIYKLKFGGNHE